MEGERENARRDEVEGRDKRKGEGTEVEENKWERTIEISDEGDGRSEKSHQPLLENERVFVF